LVFRSRASGLDPAIGFVVLSGSSLAHSLATPGRQAVHCDSGRPCSSHQSPAALNLGISEVLHRVQTDSGTPCPPHQPWSNIGLTALLPGPKAESELGSGFSVAAVLEFLSSSSLHPTSNGRAATVQPMLIRISVRLVIIWCPFW
jgi:hypothetical protein